MRIVGHGIDLVEVSRIARMLSEHGPRFLERCFSRAEVVYAESAGRRDERLAARFAAKEAALKALGTGWSSGIAWTDVEVESEGSGRPRLVVRGRAQEIADSRGVRGWAISLTHVEGYAMASVIAWGD